MNNTIIPLVLGFVLVGAILDFSILLADLIHYIHDQWVQ